MKARTDSRSIVAQQQGHQRDEFRAAVRALLMTPLMGPAHDELPIVRRNAERLREWFLRETGWILAVERDGARLFKRPADLQDATLDGAVLIGADLAGAQVDEASLARAQT